MFGIDNKYLLYAMVAWMLLQAIFSLYSKREKKNYLEVPRDHWQRGEKQVQRSIKYTNRSRYKAYKMDFNQEKKTFGHVTPCYLWNGYWAFNKRIGFLKLKRMIIVKPKDFIIDHHRKTVIFKGSDLDMNGKFARLIPCKYISEDNHIKQEKIWMDFIRSVIIRQANIDTIIDREWLSESSMRPKDHTKRFSTDGKREMRKISHDQSMEGEQDAN